MQCTKCQDDSRNLTAEVCQSDLSLPSCELLNLSIIYLLNFETIQTSQMRMSFNMNELAQMLNAICNNHRPGTNSCINIIIISSNVQNSHKGHINRFLYRYIIIYVCLEIILL